MFISIPREFFVPVVFGEGFVLNEDNKHLELDTNKYRESNGKKNTNETVSKSYFEESKSYKEKQDIVENKIQMDESKCGNINGGSTVGEVMSKPSLDENMNKEDTIYMVLKGQEGLQKMCPNYGEMFKELDDEFVENIDIKGCSDK